MNETPHQLAPIPTTSGLLAYYCQVTSEIRTSLVTLEACQKTIDLLQPEPTRERLLRQESLLQSSLYSARIEGNPLEREELDQIKESTTRHKREVQNLNRAYDWVAALKEPTKVDIPFIETLHRKTMTNLTADAGQLRYEESAIFNQAGVAVYLPPSPQLIKPQLTELCFWLHTTDYPAAIAAVMGHYIFEKIHPFLDGNGRVGRLLLFHLLNQANLSMRGLLVVEKVLATQRDEYYEQLAPTTTNQTSYVTFMLSCLAEASEAALEKLRVPLSGDSAVGANTVEKVGAAHNATVSRSSAELGLLPRRQELLNIISDHQQASFDFLSRRFPTVKKSTLHNDLASLLKMKLIQKLGRTRGVLYCLTTNG